jgi:hypothetical protein
MRVSYIQVFQVISFSELLWLILCIHFSFAHAQYMSCLSYHSHITVFIALMSNIRLPFLYIQVGNGTIPGNAGPSTRIHGPITQNHLRISFTVYQCNSLFERGSRTRYIYFQNLSQFTGNWLTYSVTNQMQDRRWRPDLSKPTIMCNMTIAWIYTSTPPFVFMT